MLKLIPPGRRKGNKFYLVRGRFAGRQVEASTKTADPVAAQRFKVNLEARLLDGDTITRVTATFVDAAAIYRAGRTLSRNEDRYITKLEKHFATTRLADIKPADIHKAASDLYPGCKPQTKNRQAIAPALAVLHVAAENDLCAHIKVKRLKGADPARPAADTDLVEVLIDGADGDLKALLTVLAYQGWRITETLNIKRANIDFEANTIKRLVSKSQVWRWTPLDPDAAQAIEDLPERADGYVFPWRTRGAAYKHIRPLAQKLGITFTPHMARRGFATALHAAGADAKSIAMAGNWEDPRSVLPYIQTGLDHARATIDKLPKRQGKRGEKMGGKGRK